VLSSETAVYKTGRFIASSHRIADADFFVSKISEGIISSANAFSYVFPSKEKISFLAETYDKAYTLFFRFGCSVGNGSVTPKDIVFYKFVSADKSGRKNDRQIVNWLERNRRFDFTVKTVTNDANEDDFSKLYTISNADNVNFPLLNAEQKRIVESEDRNMLVQGVAGSGKTNVCIDKIIFCACRNYYGKTLYTTFSRGLLIDTKTRVESFKSNLKKFVADYDTKKIIFVDKNHKKAIENKLGIYFTSDDDENIIGKIKRIIAYLTDKTDYCLIEDLYAKYISRDCKIATENTFRDEYIGDLKNYKLAGLLEKIKHLSEEVVYKEIYGMIFGRCDGVNSDNMMSRENYIKAREGSFSRTESDVIYTLACDYAKFLDKNGYTDNNRMSRSLLSVIPPETYSLSVADEVQDFTQINLSLIKSFSRKMFCVGDALQMINPSYFGFAYLKRLMYGEEHTKIAELRHNYRNSEQIEKIVERLGELNSRQFGTHNFVLKGESVKNGLPTKAVFTDGAEFIELASKYNFDKVTIIACNAESKEKLRKKFPKTEILTVSEAKGLERNTVILSDILSSNSDKWETLASMNLNRKTADENSVYRYYFNLFYVGVSRAQQYLFVSESRYLPMFSDVFDENFEKLDAENAVKLLAKVAQTIETDDEELLERITQFIGLEQYANARFTADKLSDDALRTAEIAKIDISENFVRYGKYKEAGVEFWKKGMTAEAKKMFTVSGDTGLIDLVDAASGGADASLDWTAVEFYPDIIGNKTAVNIILDALRADVKAITDTQNEIKAKLQTKGAK
jgi:hypothetical protein